MGKPSLVSFIEKVIDIPRNQQQGFKKGRGTATAALLLQSLIARALDDDCYVMVNTYLGMHTYLPQEVFTLMWPWQVLNSVRHLKW